MSKWARSEHASSFAEGREMAGSDETSAIVLGDVVTCVCVGGACIRVALASMFQAFYPHPPGVRPSTSAIILIHRSAVSAVRLSCSHCATAATTSARHDCVSHGERVTFSRER